MTLTDRIVFVVDDDPSVREALTSLFRSTGLHPVAFASVEVFYDTRGPASLRVWFSRCD